MLARCISQCIRSNRSRLTLSHKSWLRKYATTGSVPVLADRTRNIGIIAHIDAGKTTTTERMLYYAGYTRQLGDVDQGSTITDFLPAERARGITIQSAAITFSWPPPRQTIDNPPLNPGSPRSSVPHNINLIDTPGHADFTFEVLRSLRVLDGAVCILDSVAGVEAQTEKVWSQASAYSIPRIVFVNKLDRDGAAFARTVREIGSKLNAWPAVCGIPWWNADGKLQGVGDVINLKALAYPAGGDGKQVQSFSIDELETKDSKFKAELVKARIALIELLAEHDDQMVEQFFEVNEDHMAVQPKDVRESLRRCTLSTPQRVTAIFAGASFRNVGVQPLLDAVVDLLPSPEERPDPQISYDASTSRTTLSRFLKGDGLPPATDRPKSKAVAGRNNMSLQAIGACALAFKVVSDSRRGVLVYVRVYSGRLARNANLWNTTLQVSEKSQRLLRMYANDAVDVDEIEAGQIGVIPALKFTRTGDSLISHPSAHTKTGPPPPASQLQLRPINVPPPVFFVSVEPNSLSETRHVKECLELLLREDPSLNVRIDEESGQTLLAGMGELHLEIARDRLVQDLKAKARTGNIEIGYRETVNVDSGEVHEVYDKELNGKRSEASCVARVAPMSDINALHGDHTISLPDENILTINILGLDQDGEPLTSEVPALPDDLLLQDVLHALQNGTIAALARGPQHGYPIHSTAINITIDPSKDIAPSTSATTLATVARLAVQSALQKSNSMQEVAMMEPVMRVAISLPEPYLGAVVQDISSGRGGSVLSLDASQDVESSESTHRDDPVDVKRIYVPPDPFGSADASLNSTSDRQIVRTIVARVPLKEMVGYLKHLRSLTAGRGTFTMSVDRFDRMGSQRVKAMLTALRGQDF